MEETEGPQPSAAGAEAANASGTDAVAVALALNEASRDKADAFLEKQSAFLDNQSALIDLQKHHLHEQFKQLSEPAREDSHMEIHRPRAAHGIKEFAIEILTIVVGIVIAISLEQFVENRHWNSEVKIAREALRAEMTEISTFYASRLAVAPCLDQKLDRVAGMISDVAAGRQPRTIVTTFNSPGALLSDSEWQSERSSQVLTHFPRAELALMSRFYGQLPDFRTWQTDQSHAWAQLAVLQDAPQKLGPADLAQLRLNYHLVRRFELLIILNARRQLAASDALGIKHSTPSPVQAYARCNSVGGQSKF